ncbi:MAG: anti-sigma factor [Gemmatimonadaceae bacterium]|nr:anti-sigma factor [Gemmatimonadaceae bacterium]
MTDFDVHDHLAAYALGALDPDSRAAVERAIDNSPELARSARDLGEVAALLAWAAPTVALPTGLRARIMAAAGSARTIESARPIGSAPSAAPVGVARRAPSWRTAAPWFAAAASLIVVLYIGNQLSAERGARRVAEASASSLRSQLATLDSMVTILLSPAVETVALSATGRPPSARLYWNQQRRQVVFAAYGLAPAGPGRTYQLWGISTGKAPVSLGVFNTQPNGEVRARFVVAEGVVIAVGAVTEEPEGGSLQPTSTPFLVGQLKSA